MRETFMKLPTMMTAVCVIASETVDISIGMRLYRIA
jgi:hypothetical protein